MSKENEILDELHRHRAQHARDCDYDIHKIFKEIRQGTEKLRAEGWKVVSFGSGEPAEDSCVLREAAPKKSTD